MKTTLTNKLFLSDIPASLYTSICEKLTIPNPKYVENKRMAGSSGLRRERIKQRFLTTLISTSAPWLPQPKQDREFMGTAAFLLKYAPNELNI